MPARATAANGVGSQSSNVSRHIKPWKGVRGDEGQISSSVSSIGDGALMLAPLEMEADFVHDEDIDVTGKSTQWAAGGVRHAILRIVKRGP
jgi:hypothetical protein